MSFLSNYCVIHIYISIYSKVYQEKKKQDTKIRNRIHTMVNVSFLKNAFNTENKNRKVILASLVNFAIVRGIIFLLPIFALVFYLNALQIVHGRFLAIIFH